jgi:hypothetical protein
MWLDEMKQKNGTVGVYHEAPKHIPRPRETSSGNTGTQALTHSQNMNRKSVPTKLTIVVGVLEEAGFNDF